MASDDFRRFQQILVEIRVLMTAGRARFLASANVAANTVTRTRQAITETRRLIAEADIMLTQLRSVLSVRESGWVHV
jgi:hypothetical protein